MGRRCGVAREVETVVLCMGLSGVGVDAGPRSTGDHEDNWKRMAALINITPSSAGCHCSFAAAFLRFFVIGHKAYWFYPATDRGGRGLGINRPGEAPAWMIDRH